MWAVLCRWVLSLIVWLSALCMLVSCWGDRLAIVGILASLNEILESTLYPEMACTSSDTPTHASAGVCVCMYVCMYVCNYVCIYTHNM